MSLDFYLVCEDCGSQKLSANVTHNVSSMWERAGCFEALYESEGKPASQVVDSIALAIRRMEEDPGAYRALNPANGWGCYETALQFLREVASACKRWPRLTVRVSR